MSTHPTPHSRRSWRQATVWAGYVVFGFPAVAAVPAMVATVATFGLLDSLLSAGPVAAAACLPLILWIRYTRRRPVTFTGKMTWFVVAVVALGALAFSPLFFWAGPAALVLLSEMLRLLSGPTFTLLFSRVRPGRTALTVRRDQ